MRVTIFRYKTFLLLIKEVIITFLYAVLNNDQYFNYRLYKNQMIILILKAKLMLVLLFESASNCCKTFKKLKDLLILFNYENFHKTR